MLLQHFLQYNSDNHSCLFFFYRKLPFFSFFFLQWKVFKSGETNSVCVSFDWQCRNYDIFNKHFEVDFFMDAWILHGWIVRDKIYEMHLESRWGDFPLHVDLREEKWMRGQEKLWCGNNERLKRKPRGVFGEGRSELAHPTEESMA